MAVLVSVAPGCQQKKLVTQLMLVAAHQYKWVVWRDRCVSLQRDRYTDV